MPILVQIIDGIEIYGTLPHAPLGAAYSAQLRALSAYLPVYWRVADGALPDDWSIGAETGIVSGAEAENIGEYSVQIEARDGHGRYARKWFTFRILAEPMVISGTLPNAVIGEEYSAVLTITGGYPPYASVARVFGPGWILTTLDPPADIDVTGEAYGDGNGQLVVIRVTDALGDTAEFSQLIDVVPAPAGYVLTATGDRIILAGESGFLTRA